MAIRWTVAMMMACASTAAFAAEEETDTGQAVVIGQRNATIKSATKTDTKLKDVPQAVSIVTAADIEEKGLRTIGDVLRQVPGATVGTGEGHRDQIILRGQNSTADFFVDGIRDDVQYYRGLYNLDRVEVLKGPNAMIFGRGGGGGLVNRVSKRAMPVASTAARAGLDQESAFESAVDFNQPLGGAFLGRLNAGYETFDSFRDHVDGRRIGISPTIAFAPNRDTRVDLSYEYANDRRVVDRGIPSFNGKPLDGATRDFFGDKHGNRTRFTAHVADLKVEHRFSDALSWTTHARAGDYDKFYRNALAATAVTASGTVGMEAYQSRSKRQSLFVQNDLVAKFNTGALEHQLLVGADLGWQDSFSDRQQGFFDSAGTIQRLYVDVDDADDLPTITYRDSSVRRATAADTKANNAGVYVQDQIKIGRYVEVVAGLRRDWFKLDYADRLSTTRLDAKDALWSPRLGLVGKPTTDLSFYASWSKSFLPQSGDQFSSLTATTAALEPEEFVNREIGAKWEPRQGVSLAMAAYRLDRTNTRATDPVSGDTVLTGAQRSTGVEASGTVKFGDWQFDAAAALQKAKITRTTAAAPEGRNVANVPHFSGSLWGRYDISKRLGLGLGAYHQSKSYASISNAVTIPAFTRVDAAAFIGLTDKVDLSVHVENLLDRDYVATSHNDNNLAPGAPRSLKASLALKL